VQARISYKSRKEANDAIDWEAPASEERKYLLALASHCIGKRELTGIRAVFYLVLDEKDWKPACAYECWAVRLLFEGNRFIWYARARLGKHFTKQRFSLNNVANFSFHRWVAASQRGRISECQRQQMKPMNFQGKSIRPKKLSQLRKRRRPYARVFLKIRAKSCRRWGFVWKFLNSRREDLNSSYENSECVDAIPSCSALRVKESRKTHKTECRHFHILIGVLMQQDQPAHLIWFLSCLLYYLIYFVDIIFLPAHFTKILLKQTHTLRAQVKNEPICRGHMRSRTM